MAVNKLAAEDPAWASPIWPDCLPNPKDMRVLYGTLADELVIRFSTDRHYDTVVVLISTPDEDYAGVLTDYSSGAVVGIHVYPLLAFAAQIHPMWKPLAERNPPPASVVRIVEDIKELFNRYGVGHPESE